MITPKRLPFSNTKVEETGKMTERLTWEMVPHKSLRVPCPEDGAIAWLNLNGVLYCSRGHFGTVSDEAMKKLRKFEVRVSGPRENAGGPFLINRRKP